MAHLRLRKKGTVATFFNYRKEVSIAISEKHGKTTIEAIGEDEPVFILRAQDKLAEAAIESYKTLAVTHGCLTIANTLDDELQRFRQWNEYKKLPD